MSMQSFTGHGTAAQAGKHVAVAVAPRLVFALAALTYRRLDPAATARDACAACAGHAAAAWHAPDPRVRERALDTLTECAAQR